MVSELGAPYRIAQFWWAITADDLPQQALADIRALLSDNEWQLFQSFSVQDKRHGYQVLKSLTAVGVDQKDLLVAGVLHDIGKMRIPLTIFERVTVVLIEHFIPGKLLTWGQGPASGWKRPFVVKTQHPRWGSEMLAEAGSSAAVVNLVQRHQDPLPQSPVGLEDELLSLLKWADDQN